MPGHEKTRLFDLTCVLFNWLPAGSAFLRKLYMLSNDENIDGDSRDCHPTLSTLGGFDSPPISES